jgi:hypothetical protein
LNGSYNTSVNYPTTSYTLNGLYCANTIYITSVSDQNIESNPSNTITSNNGPLPPENLTLVSTTCTSATFSWTEQSTCATSYNIYQNSSQIATNITITSYTANNLSLNTDYSFYVTALSGTLASEPSNTLSVNIPTCGFDFTGSPSTNYIESTITINSITYNVITFKLGTFSFKSQCCTEVYQLFIVAGGAAGDYRNGGKGGQVLSFGNTTVGGNKIVVNTSNIFSLTVGEGGIFNGTTARDSISTVSNITGDTLNFTAIGGGGANGGIDNGADPPVLTPAENGTKNIYNNLYYGGGGGSSGGAKKAGVKGAFGGGGGGGGSYNGQGTSGTFDFNGGPGGGVDGTGTDGGAGGTGGSPFGTGGTTGTSSQKGGGGGGGSWADSVRGASGGNGGAGGGAGGIGAQQSYPYYGGSAGGGGGGGYYGGGGGAGGQGGGSGLAQGTGGGGGAGTIILIYR